MLPYPICASSTGILSAARNRPEHRPRKGRGEPPDPASASSHTLSFLHHPNAGNLATGSQQIVCRSVVMRRYNWANQEKGLVARLESERCLLRGKNEQHGRVADHAPVGVLAHRFPPWNRPEQRSL